MIRGFRYIASVIIAILITTIFLSCLGGCTVEQSEGEGFAIYLTDESGSPGEAPEISSVEIGDTPLIGLDDIICYDSDSHELILTGSAFARYQDIEGAFAVCVDRRPVYTGIFWNWFSSMSLDRIVILEKLSSENDNTLVIQAGYPGEDFYQGEDPRGDERIMNSLREVGKLVEISSQEEKIPAPMKGWELYSFERNGECYFTLIFGTNRLKWLEELVFEYGASDEDGIYHRVGTGEIITLLSQLAKDSPVYWGVRFSSDTTAESDVVISIPPDDIVNAVTYYAQEFGLDLYVHQVR
jgi:hypothetical protein